MALVIDPLVPATVKSLKFHNLPARDVKYLVLLRACADADCVLPPIGEIAWQLHATRYAIQAAIRRLKAEGFISVEVCAASPDACTELDAEPKDRQTTLALVGDFLDECCTSGRSDLWVRALHLFASYLEWSRARSEEPLARIGFGLALRHAGLMATRRRCGKLQFRVWVGCALNSAASEATQTECAQEGAKVA